MPVLFATILDTIQRFVEAGGYYVIFALLFACGLGLPLPEDVPLIIGGYFVVTYNSDSVRTAANNTPATQSAPAPTPPAAPANPAPKQ